MPVDTRELKNGIEQTLCRDRHLFRRSISRLPAANHEHYQNRLQNLLDGIRKSRKKVENRRSSVPDLRYPRQLPIIDKKEEILETIRNNQVVVITGETGSGKTTQIPKMCLEAGGGLFGKIVCTQPRRIAATSLARQVAKETNTQLGEEIGYKIRFADKSRDSTLIQFATDGILLAEVQNDRFLGDYDTIIVDEAHERTLNIDFLLGFLKSLLPKRPELKLIITSATIDVEKFSEAFPQYYCPRRKKNFLWNHARNRQGDERSGAPIIEVSGRMYPVEVRYTPIDENREEQGDLSIIDLVSDAVEEILTETSVGDILVFLSGVQEIREAMDKLRFLEAEGFSILPLFGRLTIGEQNRIFKLESRRKIILSTNIAETSITVPGIHYVVDSGRARISQYNTRSGTQGLPIEAISQSSADQRKGRCGRVTNGICIRLYSEEDFLRRSVYSTPEIQRSDLAEVILRMLSLKLGNVESFPFVDPPQSAQIRAGYRTLQELGALDEKRRLVPMGKVMATLPVDPRTARMILQAKEENVLYPVLVIAAAISCQDPREYPQDKQTQARQKHAVFVSKESDLMTLLNLWEQYHLTLDELKTQNKMRKFCKTNFLSYSRIREWRDVYHQLSEIVKEKKWNAARPDEWDYDAIHRSTLSGYLTHIARKKEKKTYAGTKNREFLIFPGSGQYRSQHDWIVAVELIETSRLFAQRVARIDPDWLESLAGDLCRKLWTQPRWDQKGARVVAWEKVTLFGFTIVEQRAVNYGKIDLEESTDIFVREALVEGRFECNLPFWRHNQALIAEIKELENRNRKRNLLVDDRILEKFYRERISDVSCLNDLKRIIKRNSGDGFLFMNKDKLMQQQPDGRQEMFPDFFEIGGRKCRLHYMFDPDHPRDGVTVELPWSLVNSLQEEPFEYLVPGLLEEKMLWLMKNLPKEVRKKLVPVSDTAARTWDAMISHRYSTEERISPDSATKEFYREFSETLFKTTQVYVEPDEWEQGNLPDHLRMNFSSQNPKTKKTLNSRILADFQKGNIKIKDDWHRLIRPFELEAVKSWDFGPLLEEVPLSREGDVALWGYRTLAIKDGELKLTLTKTREEAEQKSLEAVAFFTERELSKELGWVYSELRFPPETVSHFQNLWEGDSNVAAEILIRKFGGKPSKIKKQLHEQLQQKTFQLVCRGLCGYSGQPLWNEKDFDRHLTSRRNEIEGIGKRVVDWITTTMELRQSAYRLIQQKQIQRQGDLWSSMIQELDFFLSSECLHDIPLDQWKHCPRILQSYIRRIERYSEDPRGQERKFQEILPYQTRCRELWVHFRKATLREDWLLKQLRWMLEELKVSTFAQDLKTAFPISRKRLDKFIGENFAAE
ncbi:MAG: ATP-dependent RNA helicase HrpA [Proteobacteria bacterium]|nr:ATP-dependent RNA helicase HrpA [Pseudomonadota bacterium]